MKKFTITGEWQGARLDRFIRISLPGLPFGVVQILMRKGLIFLNDERATGNVRLSAGDVVAVNIAEVEENGRSEQPAPRRTRNTKVVGSDIRILFEDASVLVIDKPAGILVQPGNRKDKGSLLDLLENYRRAKTTGRRRKGAGNEGKGSEAAGPKESAREATPFRYTPVHRLDRQTSGALIVAKTRPAARALSRSIAERRTAKTYLAVVEGVPARLAGAIETPLATNKGLKSHSIPADDGKAARTYYWLLKRFENRALIEIGLVTGRTHQIRAHFASIGNPVVGDAEYGARSRASGGRILLHAWKIEFPHPETGVVITAIAPPPGEFRL